MRSLLRIARLDLEAPDHSTMSRRTSRLPVAPRAPHTVGPLHIIVDSTGLSIVGQGEWAAAKHGERGRRGWVKLHIAVDRQGGILAHRVTEDTADDATTAIGMFHEIEGDFATATGDRAYDTRPFYAAAEARGARVIVPPIKNASCDGHRMNGRNGTVRRVQEIGPRLWKKESGYHSQSKAENCFFRFKTIFGDRLRSRSLPAQRAEVAIACNALAVMTSLGMPDSYAVRF